MRRSLLVLCISGISSGAVASGYALWSYATGDRLESSAPTSQVQSSKAQPAPAGAGRMAALMPASPSAPASGISPMLAIEIARIDAGGASVLAGRSPPNHRVTIIANGREIASVVASDEGQWSAIISEGIAAGPLELKLESRPKEGGEVVRSEPRQLVVPAAGTPPLAASSSPPQRTAARAAAVDKMPVARAAPQQAERPQTPGQSQAQAQPTRSDEAANKRALAEFEALVERTRKEVAAAARGPASVAAGSPSNAASSPVPSTVQAPAPASTQSPPAVAAAGSPSPTAPAPETRIAAAMPLGAPAPAATSPAALQKQAPIPVPITFVTNAAALTSDGERAAMLLAEYLRLKRPAGITLSGHADARGPDGYNMRLSLRRLEAIERYLRAAGYGGELSLVPRGKREPYQGIDRTRLSRYQIHQADRRVELRLTP